MDRTYRACLTLAAVMALASPLRAEAPGNPITMPVDEVRVLTFPAPAKTVFVGNPTVADITVIDERHVFLQAKSFGSTNVLALDNGGRQIADQRVTVFSGQTAIVTLQRGTARSTLNCAASRCELVPTPGDEPESYEAMTGQIQKRDQQLKAAANGN